MNSKQIQYAIKLSETLNFSLVAEQLKISQPALSKQILSLEKELGVKLFDRNSSPMTLTPAGKYFIREAKELLYREDQLVRSMECYKSEETGQLTIGITPFRSSYMVSAMIKKLRDRYPNIQVCLHEAGSSTLRSEVMNGKYDFAVVNLPVDDSALDVIPLEKDRLVLVVPSHLAAAAELDATQGEIDFSQCRNLPFIAVGQDQEMRILFDKMCAGAGFFPNIAVEVISLTTAWSIACSGIGATILPYQFIADKNADTSLRYITIKSVQYTRQPAIVTRKGQYRTAAASLAIQLLTNP